MLSNHLILFRSLLFLPSILVLNQDPRWRPLNSCRWRKLERSCLQNLSHLQFYLRRDDGPLPGVAHGCTRIFGRWKVRGRGSSTPPRPPSPASARRERVGLRLCGSNSPHLPRAAAPTHLAAAGKALSTLGLPRQTHLPAEAEMQ